MYVHVRMCLCCVLCVSTFVFCMQACMDVCSVHHFVMSIAE